MRSMIGDILEDVISRHCLEEVYEACFRNCDCCETDDLFSMCGSALSRRLKTRPEACENDGEEVNGVIRVQPYGQ